MITAGNKSVKRMIVLSLGGLVLLAVLCHAQSVPTPAAPAMLLTNMDEAKQRDWLARWDKNITREAKNYRTCDRAAGEDIAWTMTPIMEGFFYGYMATRDTKYVDLWVDWTDSLIKRAVKEPDGYVGWPGKDPHGTQVDKAGIPNTGWAFMAMAVITRSTSRASSMPTSTVWSSRRRTSTA